MSTTRGIGSGGRRPIRRRPAWRPVVGAALTIGVLAAGCAAAPTPAAPGPGVHEMGSYAEMVSGLPSPHVHGVAVNPGDGRVYLATHHGLFRYDENGPQRVGPVIDLMGFTVAGPNLFYASGHPGPGTDLPDPVGLLRSVDGGLTWSELSRQGSSDFHALTASTAGIVGFDGQLRSSTDGATWVDLPGVVEPWTLAAAPGGAALLATGPDGLSRSTDNGRTWTLLPSAPPAVVVVSWADDATAVGVSAAGEVFVSTDGGSSWQSRGTAAPPQAVAATATGGGGIRVLVVTASAVLDSTDGGRTFTALT